MPKRSNKWKDEWGFFLNDNGRRQYNDICRRCDRDCKQSFRAGLVACKRFLSKRSREAKARHERQECHLRIYALRQAAAVKGKGIYRPWARSCLLEAKNREKRPEKRHGKRKMN